MSYGKRFQLPILALTLSSALLVLLKIIFYPNTDRYTVSPFTFPSVVPLPDWQSLPSAAIPIQKKHPNYLAGRRYQYVQAGVPLTIEMRYLNNTSGEVKEFLESYKSNFTSPTLRYQEGIGFYGIFIDRQQAYLSSCINSQGGSTVTQRQFNQNRRAYDVQLDRLLPWLLGQQKLEDKRCLWTHLSTPLKSSTAETYQLLETAWFAWYKWWYPRFPKS